MSRNAVQTPWEEAAARSFFRRNHGGRGLAAFAGLVLLVSVLRLPGQEGSKPLSPTESYKAALSPFTEARSQPNDLTEADKFALGIGIAQAARDCLALSPDAPAIAGDAKELFALGELCIFGQQFEPARAALVAYLALPQPPEREQGFLLLARAFLGLNEPETAASQVRTVLLDYPYDARIHAAMDQVIESAEGVDQNTLALELCATQNAATIPLLGSGKALEGKDGSVSASRMFADAVRCAAVAASAGKPDRMAELAGIVNLPLWAGTADLAPMIAALERQQMVGKSAPGSSLHGVALGTNGLVPRTVSLRRRTVVLVPFTLWSPSTPDMARELAKLTPRLPIYAITSWHANTGREDVRSSEVLEGLHSWQRSLPKSVSIMVVPDAVLAEFHGDVFPAGILVRNGTVLANLVLSGEGAERLLVNAWGGGDGR